MCSLSLLSKLVERIIANPLLTHLPSHNLLAKFQSANCKFHSFETALLYTQNNILVALDAGHSIALLLLIYLLLLILLIMISLFIACNISLISHPVLLIYYPLLFLIVFKLLLLSNQNFNLFY